MNIPNSFRTQIANAFYDKEIELLSVVETTNNEGQVRRQLSQSGERVKGNVQYSNLERLREEYGIDEEVELSITTQDTVETEAIRFDGEDFEVVKNIPFAAYNLIICSKWKFTQSGSISA